MAKIGVGLTDTGRLMQMVARGQAKIPDSFWKLKPDARESAATRIVSQSCGASVGVITAPRREPTLQRTLESLRLAGWPEYWVFSDGADCHHTNVTVRRPSVGAWSNWWLALQEMSLRNPTAHYYLICEDDGLTAAGARRYVEGLDLIEQDCVISLYLSARYDFTTTTRFTGGSAFTGAVSLLITRKCAERLLASGLGLEHRRSKTRPSDWIDGAIGQWCQETDTPLWVLSPGLVQHIGVTSTLGHNEKPSKIVVTDVRHIGTNTKEKCIGLLGWNTASGLGYLHRDIATHLPIAVWLSPDHDQFPRLPDIPGVQTIRSPRPVTQGVYRDFLEQLDVLLFCETPAILGYRDVLVDAKRAGVRVVCVPMIEWLDDAQCCAGIGDWPSLVDLFLCPTRQCYDMMGSLQSRSVHYPWPIDLSRVDYRTRHQCERFVFVHGTGGCHDRKGALIMAEAARLAPDCPLIVYSQAVDGLRAGSYKSPDWPAHVEVRGAQPDTASLYRDGDVCIQPSRLEGLGLQLIECQAAGMPLVTTAGDPMREYSPYRLIRATAVADRVHRPITRYDAAPAHLAAIMRELHGSDITAASDAARQFSVTRDWEAGRRNIHDLILGACVSC